MKKTTTESEPGLIFQTQQRKSSIIDFIEQNSRILISEFIRMSAKKKHFIKISENKISKGALCNEESLLYEVKIVPVQQNEMGFFSDSTKKVLLNSKQCNDMVIVHRDSVGIINTLCFNIKE